MKRFILGISFSLLSLTVFGWGQIGHRVVAEIAQDNLSSKTKKAVMKLMGNESFIEAAAWMDDIKSDPKYNHTHVWHYMNIEANQSYQDITKSKKGDIYEATQRMIAILKDNTSSLGHKKEALKMLVHLVGDFHQPLHVGLLNDKGGNSISIRWFNKASNLHRIWDSEMINSKQYSYSELAKVIVEGNPKPHSSYYSTDLDVWVKEAIALRPQIYNYGEAKSLSYKYLYDNWDTVKTQLYKGGLRLAAILNEIYE